MRTEAEPSSAPELLSLTDKVREETGDDAETSLSEAFAGLRVSEGREQRTGVTRGLAAASALEPPAPGAGAVPLAPSTMGVGTVVEVLDSYGSQETAIRLVDQAEEYVLMLSFTFDREDLVDALVAARRRGVQVTIGSDKKWTLSGKTKDQLKMLLRLQAEGCEVRCLVGVSCGPEYRALGRAPYNGLGLLHAKVVHTDGGSVIGSCNWTTSSRANIEVGVHVKFTSQESSRLLDEWSAQILDGVPLREAAQLAEQRARSASPLRGASRSRSVR